jgi:hypothetical protein
VQRRGHLQVRYLRVSARVFWPQLRVQRGQSPAGWRPGGGLQVIGAGACVDSVARTISSWPGAHARRHASCALVFDTPSSQRELSPYTD